MSKKPVKDNVIFVGRKPSNTYVLSVFTSMGVNDEVVLKARGKAISTAVDTAEIFKNRFGNQFKASQGDIVISTEEVEGDEGPVKVSAIEITIKRGKKPDG